MDTPTNSITKRGWAGEKKKKKKNDKRAKGSLVRQVQREIAVVGNLIFLLIYS